MLVQDDGLIFVPAHLSLKLENTGGGLIQYIQEILFFHGFLGQGHLHLLLHLFLLHLLHANVVVVHLVDAFVEEGTIVQIDLNILVLALRRLEQLLYIEELLVEFPGELY